MPTSPDPAQCELFFAATHGDGARESVALRRACAYGDLVRLHRGAYVRSRDLSRLDARGRHVVFARAVVLGLSDACIVSHASAAVLHGLPRVHATAPEVISVIDPRRTTTSRSTHLFRRPGPWARGDDDSICGVAVTGLERTAVDVARTSPLADAVLCLDAVLRRLVLPRGHETGPAAAARLADVRARLLERLGEGSRPGDRNARRALLFASPWAENGGESLLRLALFELGVPDIELRRTFRVRGQFAGRCDAYSGSARVAVELDGFIKLTDAAMLAGRTPAEVVRDRDRRDRRLLECPDVRRVVHCEYRDLVQPARLAALLIGAGVDLDPRRVTAAARAAAVRFAGGPDEPRSER